MCSLFYFLAKLCWYGIVNSWNQKEIRQKFLDFFEKNDHFATKKSVVMVSLFTPRLLWYDSKSRTSTILLLKKLFL